MIRIRWSPKVSTDRTAIVETWGDGRRWLDERRDDLLGLNDDVSGFDPHDTIVRRPWRQHRGLRITANHTLWHDTAWLIPGQRVACSDAAAQWASLTRTFSEPASRPIDPAERSEVHPPVRAFDRPSAPRVSSQTRTHPGLGQWTSTNIATMTSGRPDEVVVADYSLPSFVTRALACERVGNDERMLELLEPFPLSPASVARLPSHHGTRHTPASARTEAKEPQDPNL